MDAVWVRKPGHEPTPRRRRSSRRSDGSPAILGAHFLEEEGDDLVETVRRVAVERGSTYIFVGTPDESRRREIFGGSLLSRMVRELPGIDIRVVADRTDRDRLVAMIAAVIALAALSSCSARRSPRRATGATACGAEAGAPRILVPFTGGQLDPTVLERRDPDRPRRGRRPRPVVPARRPARVPGGFAARRAGERRDAAARSGRARSAAAPACPSTRGSRRDARRPTPPPALGGRELRPRSSRPPRPTGTAASRLKDVTWILAHSPSETVILKPTTA